MMWRHIALWAVVLLALTQSASAAEQWNCIRSVNFELYTTSDVNVGRDTLVFFEEVRRAFTETLGVKLPINRQVTIISFRDDKAFAPYRPLGNIAAYTESIGQHDYILMPNLTPENYSIALHEFTHVVIAQAGMKLPLWLDEGFAEFYGTLKPEGRRILVGRVIPERLEEARSGLIDLHEVFSINRSSKLYHDPNRNLIFYAESWALVHMLKFSNSYSAGFERLLDAIGRGQPSDQALLAVYGKTVEQIQVDLQAYLHNERFRQGVIKAKLEKAVPEPQLARINRVDFELLLAGIEVRGPNRQEGIQHLEELAKANPGDLAPIESLARVQLGSPDHLASISAFRRAVEAGTRDANLCYQFATRLRAWIPDAEYVAALQRAAEIDPGFSAAQEEIAAHAFNSRDYVEAVRRFRMVKKMDRSRAFMYYRALAFASFQIGNSGDAKTAAARAQEYAVTPEEKRLADDLLKFVAGANTAIQQ
jgi:hypothetical protein